MIWYEVVEGKHRNDYDNGGDFLKQENALAYARTSKYPYVRVDQFEGDEMFDGNYTDTIYEKGINHE